MTLKPDESERAARLRIEGYLKLAINGLVSYGDHTHGCQSENGEDEAEDRLFDDCDCGFTELVRELRRQ